MRPKKRILILAPDDDSRALLLFTLATWGYAVNAAENVLDATKLAGETLPELIIANPDFQGIKQALKDLRAWSCYVPQMLLAPGWSHPPADVFTDAVMYGRFSQEELRARVIVMSARKRGPRAKGEIRKPVQSEAPAALSAEDRRFA